VAVTLIKGPSKHLCFASTKNRQNSEGQEKTWPECYKRYWKEKGKKVQSSFLSQNGMHRRYTYAFNFLFSFLKATRWGYGSCEHELRVCSVEIPIVISAGLYSFTAGIFKERKLVYMEQVGWTRTGDKTHSGSPQFKWSPLPHFAHTSSSPSPAPARKDCGWTIVCPDVNVCASCCVCVICVYVYTYVISVCM